MVDPVQLPKRNAIRVVLADPGEDRLRFNIVVVVRIQAHEEEIGFVRRRSLVGLVREELLQPTVRVRDEHQLSFSIRANSMASVSERKRAIRTAVLPNSLVSSCCRTG